MTNTKILFGAHYLGWSLEDIFEDLPEVAERADRRDEIHGAINLVKWQLEHKFFAPIVARTCLEHLWDGYNLGDLV